ncbi:helix-turn-helix domain-containing protein [Actinomadura geliboluensis]|uniref:helix-turn-helix domain-containing protein n=1 Tax=Actinomadura geliboluensis TaxID=882440 RepID=UPI0036A8097E
MTFHGRCLLVRRVVFDGRPVAHVAAGLGVSRRCAHRWVGRYRRQGWDGRPTGAAAPARPRPRLRPRPRRGCWRPAANCGPAPTISRRTPGCRPAPRPGSCAVTASRCRPPATRSPGTRTARPATVTAATNTPSRTR